MRRITQSGEQTKKSKIFSFHILSSTHISFGRCCGWLIMEIDARKEGTSSFGFERRGENPVWE